MYHSESWIYDDKIKEKCVKKYGTVSICWDILFKDNYFREYS